MWKSRLCTVTWMGLYGHDLHKCTHLCVQTSGIEIGFLSKIGGYGIKIGSIPASNYHCFVWSYIDISICKLHTYTSSPTQYLPFIPCQFDFFNAQSDEQKRQIDGEASLPASPACTWCEESTSVFWLIGWTFRFFHMKKQSGVPWSLQNVLPDQNHY